MRVGSKWSDTEAGREVQVSWGRAALSFENPLTLSITSPNSKISA